MTLKELSQLYYLRKEINLHERRIAEIRASLQSPTSPRLTGMPKGGHSSPMEDGTDEIIRIEKMIHKLRKKCRKELAKLEKYIASIEDSQTRQIFILRFEHGLSWVQVANRMGGGNTDDGVKKICYRYLKN